MDRKEHKVTEEVEQEEDDDLYAQIGAATGSKAKSSSGTSLRHDDDTPFHSIDFIHDVPLRLSVEIGQTTMSVREILSMNIGTVVEFTKVVGEPMDITISGRLMARGEIVVVNERYGVRISEVTRPDEAGSVSSRNT
ncbi:MAG: flagellar motor switch protein FliN [Deltaproteobacteria bacterium]|nr:flagellar motor switch protein FliN [Deltaproteobacteria bacterium]